MSRHISYECDICGAVVSRKWFAFQHGDTVLEEINEADDADLHICMGCCMIIRNAMNSYMGNAD